MDRLHRLRFLLARSLCHATVTPVTSRHFTHDHIACLCQGLAVAQLLLQFGKGCLIAPSMPGLYLRHPQLHLDISADDRIADMARDGFDIALRSGSPNSDTVVARQIGSYGRTLCASPDYLRAHGTPTHPRELGAHRLLANSVSPSLNRWALADPQGPTELQISGHTRTDNTALVVSLVLHGVGIARIRDLAALPLIRQGRLVPLLQENLSSPPVPIYAVILQERHRLPKIRACIDYWAEWMAHGQTT